MCQYYTKKTDRRPYEKFADGKIVCIEDEIPFDLPNGWAWTRLRDVSLTVSTRERQVQTKQVRAIGKYAVVSQSANFIDGYSDDTNKVISELPIILFGDHTRIVKYIDFDFVVGADGTKLFSPMADAKWMYYWTSYVAEKIGSRGYGRHWAILNAQFLALPPLAEQKRIVSKVEELFAEAEKTSAAVNEITRTAERINKKVLDLAIRGQLVPQDPNDEPAEELLKRIAEARQRNANKKSRKSKCEESVIFCGADRSAYEARNGKTVCIDDEIPFDIPNSWAWTRLGDIFQHNTGKALNRNSSGGEFKEYITTSNVYWDEFKLDTLKSMRFTEDELDKCTIKEGDLLVCEGGDIGRAAIWNLKREVCIQNHLHRLRPYMEICRSYFCFALRHYKYTNRLQGKGIGLQGFSSGMLHSLLIPFPPLAEQKRIVAKIEEVRKLTRSLTM